MWLVAALADCRVTAVHHCYCLAPSCGAISFRSTLAASGDDLGHRTFMRASIISKTSDVVSPLSLISSSREWALAAVLYFLDLPSLVSARRSSGFIGLSIIVERLRFLLVRWLARIPSSYPSMPILPISESCVRVSLIPGAEL